MGKLNVKNGTPVGNAHLCRSCSYGQFTVGYRESEVLVVCSNSSPALLVPFPVYECTGYWDRNRPSYDEMSRLALNFSEGHRKAIAGFRDGRRVLAPATASGDCKDEQVDEAAIRR